MGQQSRDGSMYVCAARQEKVWLSKPGGVSGSVGYVLLYPVSGGRDG